MFDAKATKERFDNFFESVSSAVEEIEGLVGGRAEVLSEFFWDQISEIKGVLGSEAANSGSELDAENLISEAEAWVTDNLSGSGLSSDIGLTLWLFGEEEGRKKILEELAGGSC